MTVKECTVTDSPLFGGILPPPEKRLEAIARKQLEQWRANWPHDTLYRGGADLLLRHGRFYRGRTLPAAYEHLRGPEGNCFENALLAAERQPELFYCEGYYKSGSGHFTGHAWCVDAQHQVFDPTAPANPEEFDTCLNEVDPSGGMAKMMGFEHWGYWGACFDVSMVREMFDTEGLPLLDRNAIDREIAPRIISAGRVDMTDQRVKWPVLERPWHGPKGLQ